MLSANGMKISAVMMFWETSIQISGISGVVLNVGYRHLRILCFKKAGRDLQPAILEQRCH
jgi:hypothetical protein